MTLISKEEWISRLSSDGTTLTTEVKDLIKEYLTSGRRPVLDTTMARKAAGQLVDVTLMDEVLDLYVGYACGSS